MKHMRKIKILYVEDDIIHANMIEDMLSKCKHIQFIIEHKGDLKSSITYLKSIDCDIDIILLDLILPNSQGVNTFEMVKLCSDLPVVIMSEFEDIARECIELGAQDYLIKADISTSLVARSLEYAIERKKLLDEKVNLEKRFSCIIQSSPLGVHIYEFSEGELYICGYNPAADEILNIDHSKLLGMKIEDAFPTIGSIKEAYINVIKTGESWKSKLVNYKDDNIKGAFNVYAFRTHENKMATNFEDVTVKNKIQDELKKSEKKYRELIEISRAAVYEIDFVINKFIYVNDFVCEQTGYTREEFLNMSIKDLLTEKSYREFNDRVVQLRRGEYISNEFEYSARTKSGDIVWVIISATYKEDKHGNIIGAKVIAVDITKTKKAQIEAKQKEEIIFNNLELKIKEWREEITLKSMATKAKLDEINLNINSMTISEVR